MEAFSQACSIGLVAIFSGASVAANRMTYNLCKQKQAFPSITVTEAWESNPSYHTTDGAFTFEGATTQPAP